MKITLAKEKSNKNSEILKCDICGEVKAVYLKSKLKVTHSKDSVFCSKRCVKKGFGYTPLTKSK